MLQSVQSVGLKNQFELAFSKTFFRLCFCLQTFAELTTKHYLRFSTFLYLWMNFIASKVQLSTVQQIHCTGFTVSLYFVQPAFTCSKLTIEALEQGVKYVNFELILHLVAVFLLLTLSR